MNFNASKFAKISKEVFAPVYPVIVNQIIKDTCKTKGNCLDIGTGPGYLGIEMAKATNCKVYLFDICKEILQIADENIKKQNLDTKVSTVKGDVHNIPFKDKSFDIIISRGSIFFWENQIEAFKEIYRVLAPNGITYIGGGFGNLKIKEEINNIMEKKDKNWHKDIKDRIGKDQVAEFKDKLEKANISNFEIKKDESGLWIIIRRTK